jgi:hypothetical protein
MHEQRYSISRKTVIACTAPCIHPLPVRWRDQGREERSGHISWQVTMNTGGTGA